MASRAVLALLALLAPACKSDAPPPAHDAAPPPPSPPPIAAGPPPIDAPIVALFDHLAVRTVKRVTPARTIPLPAGMLQPVKLAVTSETRRAHHPDPLPDVPLPPWMQTRIGKEPIRRVQQEPDGSWLAVAGQIVIVIGADHRPEIALDFGEVRADIPEFENVELRMGGDHAFVALILAIRDVHRAGPVLAVETSLGSTEEHVLLGVDIATGEIAWVSRKDTAWEGFAIAGGHAITSARTGAGWTLAAIALDSGQMDSSARARHGAYRLTPPADGRLAGVMPTPYDPANGGEQAYDLAATIAVGTQ